MSNLTETAITTKNIYNGKVLRLYVDTVRLPNGESASREYVRNNGAVCIVPITENNEVVMVKQYRYPFAKVTLEVPAGKLEPNENIEQCAARELSEETGANAEKLIFIGEYAPSPAILDEVIYMFIAKGLTYDKKHTDEDEFIDVEKIKLNELVDMILKGEIVDGKTQTAILKAKYLL